MAKVRALPPFLWGLIASALKWLIDRLIGRKANQAQSTGQPRRRIFGRRRRQ